MKYESYNVQQLVNRKNKPWQARLKYKDPATGKWKETSKILKDVSGKREAKKAAEAWFNEMNEAASNSPSLDINETIDEKVTQYLDYQLRTGEIEKSSKASQTNTYKEYIKPYIGNYSFATLDRNAINIWLTKLNDVGLAQSTIKQSYSILRKVYNYYYRIGELTKNPLFGVKPPKAAKIKVTHLTTSQMDDYLKAVYSDYEPKDNFYIAALLLFYSGLRRAEVCALKWRDIDFINETLSVESSIGIITAKNNRVSTYTKQPKTKASIRKFKMIPQLTEALKERKEAVNPEPQYYVCGNGMKYYNPTTLSYHFSNFVKRHNLVDAYNKLLTPHMLRHNLGAIGIRSGMDIASLSRMFGHASRAMTLDIYGDASKDAMVVAASKLADTFDSETEYFKREDS